MKDPDMKCRKLVAIALTLLQVYPATAPAWSDNADRKTPEQRPIIYSSPFLGYSNSAQQRAFGYGATIIDTSQGEIVQSNASAQFRLCTTNEMPVCGESEIFTFGVPRKFSKGDIWNVGRHRFVLLEVKTILFRGEPLRVLSIRGESTESSSKQWFVYSSKFGVVAFAQWSEPSKDALAIVASTFFLDSQTGFGAVE